MPFISSLEAENVYFIRGFEIHEICILSFTRWNKWHISIPKFEYPLYTI